MYFTLSKTSFQLTQQLSCLITISNSLCTTKTAYKINLMLMLEPSNKYNRIDKVVFNYIRNIGCIQNKVSN